VFSLIVTYDFSTKFAKKTKRYFIGKQNIDIYRGIDKIAKPYSAQVFISKCTSMTGEVRIPDQKKLG